MRRALVFVLAAALATACGMPTEQPTELDPVSALACHLMPHVRQVQTDVHRAVESAGRGDEQATRVASERAGADAQVILDAVKATRLHGEALGDRLVQILSVGLWGQQVMSFFTGGSPDAAAIASFAATTRSLDALVDEIAAGMVADRLGDC